MKFEQLGNKQDISFNGKCLLSVQAIELLMFKI